MNSALERSDLKTTKENVQKDKETSSLLESARTILQRALSDVRSFFASQDRIFQRARQYSDSQDGATVNSERASSLIRNLASLQEKAISAFQDFRMEIIDVLKSGAQPIPRYEEFVPALAVKEILEAPFEERGEKLEEFKERYAYQQERIAELTDYVIVEIRKNPDLSIDAFVERINSHLGDRHRLNSIQKYRFEQALQDYKNLHQAIKKAREEYPKDDALFNALFGRTPKGPVEIIEGPMTLYIRAHHSDDYALINSQSFMEGREPTEGELLHSQGFCGVSIPSSKIPELSGVIIAENAQGRPFGEHEMEIYKHEEQHAIHRLFAIVMESAQLKQLEECADDTQRERILLRYLRQIRMHFEERAKDEVLAYFAESHFSQEQIIELLFKSRADGGIYDYMSGMAENMYVLWVGSDNPNLRKAAALLHKTAADVFEQEYRELLKEACAIYERALMWYPPQQAKSLFEHEPLRKWKKVFKRITEGRDIRFTRQ